MLQQRDESDALQAVAAMQQGRVVDLDVAIALRAAKVSAMSKLPMVDKPTAGSIMLTTAQMHDATLWTQDADFEGLDGAQYVERK